MSSRRRLTRRRVALIVLAVLLGLWVFDRGFTETDAADSGWARRTRGIEKRLDVQGRTVRVLDTGEGPVVLLLHGWSDSSFTWREMIPRLEPRFRLIAPDLPGFGYSDKQGPAMSYAELAGFCAGLLDAMEVERAVVVGNSMGGGTAIKLAADFPQRVRGLVAIDAAAGLAPGEGPWLRSLLDTAGINRAAVWVMGRLTHRLSLHSAVQRSERITDEVLEEMYLPLNTAGGRRAMLDQFVRIHDDPIERADVERVRAPTLIVWGRDDAWLPLEAGRRLHSWIPGSRLEVLDGVGHLPQWEAPQRTAELIGAFLDGLPPEADAPDAADAAPTPSASPRY